MGWQIYAVRPGNVWARLGLKNGDTIHLVDGMPIATPDNALDAYSRLRGVSHITVEILRRQPNGEKKKIELNYHW